MKSNIGEYIGNLELQRLVDAHTGILVGMNERIRNLEEQIDKIFKENEVGKNGNKN